MRIVNGLSGSMRGALLVIAVYALVACGSDVNDKEYVATAKNYMAAQQVREAVIELKNALQINAENAEARYLLAEISMQIGDMPAAETEFQRALAMGWNAEAAIIGKVRAMVAQRKFKDVIELSVATDGWSAAAQANLQALTALSVAGEGDLLKAQNSILAAEKIDADAYDVLKTTFLLQLAEKRKKDAGITIARVLKLFPDTPELMLLSANLAILNKQNEEAIRVFEQIIKSGPDSVMTLNKKRAHIGILKLSVSEKNFELANKTRDIFVAKKINDPEVNYLLAVLAFEEKDFDKAEVYLQKILKIADAHPPTLLLSGATSFAMTDYEKASYYLEKYLLIQPQNMKARKLLGRTYMALGQFSDAEGEFSAALNSNADDPELTALLGLSEISGGQLESGIAELEKALLMAPDSRSLKQQLAKAYIAKGETGAAIKQLDEVLENGDKNYQVRYMKVLAYLRSGETGSAMQITEKMLLESPENPNMLNLMGNIQLVAKDKAMARSYFNKALSIEAGHLSSALSLARLDEAKGEVAAAEERYLSLLELHPGNISVMNRLASLAARQKDTAGRIKWLDAVRKADEKDLMSRVALAEIYLRQKNIADTEAVVRELEVVHADAPVVLVVKSRLLMAQKRHTQAESVILALIAARPAQDAGYYLQAQNQLALGEKAEALKSLRKAYEIQPDALRNMVLLARLEQSSGNYAQAQKLGEAVIASVPDSAAGYVIKGDAMLASKNARQAQQAFDKAWVITPGREVVVRRFKAASIISGINSATPILVDWLETHADDAAVTLNLATAYFVDKQNEKAAHYFEIVLVLDEKNTIALNNLAWLYGLNSDKKSLERALVLAEQAYKINPESPGVIDTYGWILLKNNRAAEALTPLKLAADKLPDIAVVQYHYAKALYITGDKTAATDILRPLIDAGKDFDGRNDAEMMLRR